MRHASRSTDRADRTRSPRATRASLAGATVLAFVLAPSLARADPQAPPKPHPALAGRTDLPAAQAADVASVDAIVTAFAHAISAPAGGTLDPTRLASLFVPGGRIAIGIDPKPGRAADVVFVSPETYVARFNAMSTAAASTDKAHDKVGKDGKDGGGFFDRVLANRTERFGIMAHVYSAYESLDSPTAATPFRRGIKSFELLQSGGRWYIVEVFYDFERPGNPIPQADLTPSTG